MRGLSAKLLAIACATFGMLGVGLGATGCTTDAFCFDKCGTGGGSGGTAAMGSTSSGLGGFTNSSSTGDCFPNCNMDGGPDGCVQTNGGIEICDGIDNDCNGAIDDLPGLDLSSPKTCGTCSNNCTTQLLNNDPASIMCTPSGMMGVPGKCTGMCAQDYWDNGGSGDTAGDGKCEYYCVKTANDDKTCDKKDDDCDGQVDEDVDVCTSVTDCGVCGHKCVVLHGTPACVHTGAAMCDASNTACQIAGCDCNGPGDCWWNIDKSVATGCEYQCDLTDGGAGMGVEVCGDGIDNDCDGLIDEADDLSMDPKIGVACNGSPNGVCGDMAHAGKMGCVSHQYVCTGANVVFPNMLPEICNNQDDDCNGTVDDNLTDTGASCGTSSIFPCTLGSMQCVTGALKCVGAVNPGVESCNGLDDDCDGTIDKMGGQPPADAVGPCNVPIPPPNGATSPCKAGAKTCIGGTVQCVGSVGPSGPTDTCGVDANCDGVLTNQPNTMTDVHNCGTCGNDCYAGSVHSVWACVAGGCVFQNCQNGFWDNGGPGDPVAGDNKCGYACNFVSAQEACNGVDDNCNGQVDEGVVAPSPVSVCGVSAAASAPECTTGVSVTCTLGSWKCTFPANVCNPTCATAMETCDALDNNCNGLLNENTPTYGKPCASDDAAPGTQGVCRTTGSFICNGGNATKCSATINLALAGPELCDGLDNDCDGLVDETFNNKGSNVTYFVQPAVTKIAASLWVYSYEASRPTATNVIPGQGNGYSCASPGPCLGAVPPAPPGTPLDKTTACSVPNRIPWFNVTPIEVEETCFRQGGHVCTQAEWQTACITNPPGATTCTFGYAPNGAACTSAFNAANKFCNLGPTYDFDLNAANGDQDGLLPTGSANLKNCYGDWTALLANGVANGKIFDITGNLREVTKVAANTYALMGGAFDSGAESGATCQFSFYQVDQNFKLFDEGFRCCFSADPTK